MKLGEGFWKSSADSHLKSQGLHAGVRDGNKTCQALIENLPKWMTGWGKSTQDHVTQIGSEHVCYG